MEECPFLTTFYEDVECFKECSFYECNENGGICPFKQFTDNDSSILNKVYEALENRNKEKLEYILSYGK